MDSAAMTGNRPRTQSRGLSFASNRSGGSKNELKQVESPKDKARRDSLYQGASKANPNAAIIEVQPADANLREASTLLNLREQRHTDSYGNVIVDPDLSNPTRPRLERPLDTIRSFEKAIDDGYKRRSTYKPEPEPYDQNNQFASRRSSYFGGYDNGPSANRYAQQQGGYYGSPNNGGPQQRQRHGARGQSDPQFYGQQRPYQQPQHSYHQSHDTVNTNGSDSTGPWASHTDPSSENSSLDRVNAMGGKSPSDAYAAYNQAQGQNGGGYNGPIMEEQGQGSYGDYPYQNGYGQQNHGDGFRGPRDGYGRHNTAPSERRPMQLNSGPPPPHSGLPPTPTRGGDAEKRKSWFSRKLSKKSRD